MALPWWPNCGGIEVSAILSQPSRLPQAKAYLGNPGMKPTGERELHRFLSICASLIWCCSAELHDAFQ